MLHSLLSSDGVLDEELERALDARAVDIPDRPGDVGGAFDRSPVEAVGDRLQSLGLPVVADLARAKDTSHVVVAAPVRLRFAIGVEPAGLGDTGGIDHIGHPDGTALVVPDEPTGLRLPGQAERVVEVVVGCLELHAEEPGLTAVLVDDGVVIGPAQFAVSPVGDSVSVHAALVPAASNVYLFASTTRVPTGGRVGASPRRMRSFFCSPSAIASCASRSRARCSAAVSDDRRASTDAPRMASAAPTMKTGGSSGLVMAGSCAASAGHGMLGL
ncbi:hypothetical protein [Frigoribacterium sp. Leaf186]|uniref:hypothetical protein n=1 Tax=Frigoribacterium sp. Leaf186 TaxID=1736293 RepID=UPI0006FB29A3|nr:hypothetical protein [Frigoribacterium sp. Leaf186]KQS22379.1 hypothetical protein ASG05_01950 [Frigoribacterium sp. Leaf186]